MKINEDQADIFIVDGCLREQQRLADLKVPGQRIDDLHRRR